MNTIQKIVLVSACIAFPMTAFGQQSDVGQFAPQIGGTAKIDVDTQGAVVGIGLLGGDSIQHIASVGKGNIGGDIDIKVDTQGALVSVGLLGGNSCQSIGAIGASAACANWKTLLAKQAGGVVEKISGDVTGLIK